MFKLINMDLRQSHIFLLILIFFIGAIFIYYYTEITGVTQFSSQFKEAQSIKTFVYPIFFERLCYLINILFFAFLISTQVQDYNQGFEQIRFSLPVSRKQVVFSKYFMILLFYFSATMSHFLLMFLVKVQLNGFSLSEVFAIKEIMIINSLMVILFSLGNLVFYLTRSIALETVVGFIGFTLFLITRKYLDFEYIITVSVAGALTINLFAYQITYLKYKRINI